MPQPRILVIGEALVDIVREAAGAHVEHVGGSPANVAVGLARLDHPVRFATAIGADQRGERIADHLTRRGVRITKRSVTEHPTSTAQVTFDPDHNATYEFDIHWHLAPVKVGRRDTHIHAGSLATALEPGQPDGDVRGAAPAVLDVRPGSLTDDVDESLADDEDAGSGHRWSAFALRWEVRDAGHEES